MNGVAFCEELGLLQGSPRLALVLSELRYFAELANRLSFTAAAEALGVTQPTLSTAIKNLEGKLGQRLFDRDTRVVRLTPFGREALRLALRLLETAASTEQELNDFAQGRIGRLRLAGPSILFATTLQSAMIRFKRENPGVVLEVEDTDGDSALSLLQRDLADFAMVPFPPDLAQVSGHKIGIMRAVAVFHADQHHPIPAQITWADLARHTVVILKSRDGAGRSFNAGLRETGTTFQHVYRLNEFPAVKGMIEAGFGIGVMSDLTASQLQPPFVQVPIVAPEQALDIHVCRSTLRSPTPIMGRFLGLLKRL